MTFFNLPLRWCNASVRAGHSTFASWHGSTYGNCIGDDDDACGRFFGGIFFLVQGLKKNAGLKLKIHRIHVVDFWVDFCQGDDGVVHKHLIRPAISWGGGGIGGGGPLRFPVVF